MEKPLSGFAMILPGPQEKKPITSSHVVLARVKAPAGRVSLFTTLLIRPQLLFRMVDKVKLCIFGRSCTAEQRLYHHDHRLLLGKVISSETIN